MEKFKLDHHIKANGGLRLTFRTLSDAACWTLRERLASRLGLAGATASVPFLQMILRALESRATQNAQGERFDLMQVFRQFAIVPREKCLVNFYRFDRIYEFPTTQLATYFDDIWYPGPDDIEIFDDDLTWMISVDHDGFIIGGKLSRST